jgi:hypothetical protein
VTSLTDELLDSVTDLLDGVDPRQGAQPGKLETR